MNIIHVYVHIQIYVEKSYDFMYMYNDAVPKLVFMRVSYQSHIKGSPGLPRLSLFFFVQE